MMLTLLKREYWEHRGALLLTPVVISGVMLVLTAFAMLTGRFASHIELDNGMTTLSSLAQYFASLDTVEKHEIVQNTLNGVAVPFHIALFFIVVFYALGSLYDERRDRSILFWRSLPVSDSRTVAAKLITALVIAPALTLGVVFATQLLWLVLATFLAWSNDISAWDNLWAPAELWSTWPRLAWIHVLHALWFAPVIGWLLLVSSYAKKAPLLLAILVPVGVAWVEHQLTGNAWLFRRIGERLSDGLFTLRINHHGPFSAAPMGEFVTNGTAMFTQASLWVGLAIAAAFIAGAIILRRRSGEI